MISKKMKITEIVGERRIPDGQEWKSPDGRSKLFETVSEQEYDLWLLRQVKNSVGWALMMHGRLRLAADVPQQAIEFDALRQADGLIAAVVKVRYDPNKLFDPLPPTEPVERLVPSIVLESLRGFLPYLDQLPPVVKVPETFFSLLDQVDAGEYLKTPELISY